MSAYDLLPCEDAKHPNCNIAHERLALEARIIRGLIRGLKSEGWQAVSVFTDEHESVRTEAETLTAVCSVDESTITFEKNGERNGILIVKGNGIDCICDADSDETEGWNAAFDRITDELMEKYDG